MPRLLVIGAGPLRGHMERMARAAGISDSVRFLGMIPHKEIARWMNAAHCLCLPSRSEGMPNVVLEALASGLPVVATDVGEAPFLVKDGENGFVVSGEDDVPARLAAALKDALNRDWNRREIATRANVCSWDETAAVILKEIAGD
jgi:glycosyltransferase involved in cell wall biosynthesis